MPGDHSFSTYAKSSENLTFLTPWYVWISGGKKCWFFGKYCVLTKWIIPCLNISDKNETKFEDILKAKRKYCIL